MGHGTRVSSINRTIAGGLTLVGGVQRKITKGLTLVGGVQREIAFEVVGTPIGDLSVGTSVYTKVNGTKTEFLVVHQGKPGSSYDESCNGTWLVMKDIYANQVFSSSKSNIYSSSGVNSYLKNTFLKTLSTKMQSLIKSVKIPYVNGNGNTSSVSSGSNGLSTQIFLLSGTEIGMANSTSDGITYYEVGACLSYFSTHSGVAKLNGTAAIWWCRDPIKGYTSSVRAVGTNGLVKNEIANNSRGVRPAFILPQDALINENFEII